METLASIWQALVDSDAFWMIDEIAWPLIQGLGILLALLVSTLLVALLSYHFGDDDEEDEEEDVLDIPMVTPDGYVVHEAGGVFDPILYLEDTHTDGINVYTKAHPSAAGTYKGNGVDVVELVK